MDELIRELEELNELAAKLEIKLKNLINKTKFVKSKSKKVSNLQKSLSGQLKAAKVAINKTKLNIRGFKRALTKSVKKQTLKLFGGNLKSASPFEDLLDTKTRGIGVSIWNVIQSIAEGQKDTNYWINIVRSYFDIMGHYAATQFWVVNYFDRASGGYDVETDQQDENFVYITDGSTGKKTLEEIEYVVLDVHRQLEEEEEEED